MEWYVLETPFVDMKWVWNVVRGWGSSPPKHWFSGLELVVSAKFWSKFSQPKLPKNSRLGSLTFCQISVKDWPNLDRYFTDFYRFSNSYNFWSIGSISEFYISLESSWSVEFNSLYILLIRGWGRDGILEFKILATGMYREPSEEPWDA